MTQKEINDYLEKLNHEMFIKVIPVLVLFTVAPVVGLSGNLLVFVVYLKQFKASATRVFVLGMTVCDFLINALTIPWVIVDLRYRYTKNIHFCRMTRLLWEFFLSMSYLILVLVAIDRRRRICQVYKRQLSARQATYLLIVPLTLTLAASVPSTYLYGTKPLKTDRPQITGTTCGFSDKPAKYIFGIVEIIYFLFGYAVLTICYAQIYRTYQQQKRVRARKINIVLTSAVMTTQLKEEVASRQDEPENVSEKIFTRPVKFEKSDEKLSSQDTHLSVETETLTRDQRDENFISQTEDKADGHDSQRLCFQDEVSRCSSSRKHDEADCTTRLQLPQKSLYKMTSAGCEDLSDPVLQPSPAKETPSRPCEKMSSVLSTDIEQHEEVNMVSGSGADRTERIHQKRALLSKTTFMMLVLTIATLICLVSYIVVTMAHMREVGVQSRTWQMNMYFFTKFFPTINSVINPFVYSICNPQFRLQCRRFFTKLCNR
ncbi:histamine H1 receptor-like [Pomacea canaliculata]|uniref:histamine H1 receptor-like n=1 Tax=Pomacea canaliculata TaxID=400727 RepID=UPI000D7290A1|nr:histamine H1 receptor-like [Pomacea canaliculata]